ncbi:MAG TPA: hypothetical protein VFR81_21885 [Longimicrobium sp.]|nr:hypothetical protein [Longimicrobium sp.]
MMGTIALAAVLALGACEGASRSQGGDPDKQGDGQAPEEGQGTIVNDTTPARPGAPSPLEVPPPAGQERTEPTEP